MVVLKKDVSFFIIIEVFNKSVNLWSQKKK